MPNLMESLQGRDLGHLRIIAELWGIELPEQELKAALLQLASGMLASARVRHLVEHLPPAEKETLMNLASAGGRLGWAQFTRRFGEIREMGVAKRDRDLPYKQPVSPVEALWYKGLLARAFFDTPAGPEEFAYIPDDLLAQVSLDGIDSESPLGRQAFAAEYTEIFLANDAILDQACTQLAAMRLGISLTNPFHSRAGEELSPAILKQLLAACGLVDPAGMPLPEPVREFLEASRAEALVQLFGTWRQTSLFNELCMLPNLIPEGNWSNDPPSVRQVLLENLRTLPVGAWWSLVSFIAAMKKSNPDFQRPAGDYDSWFIRDTKSGEFLRGFEHWEQVDGCMIRFILTGPLHWLGMVDLASPQTSNQVSAFRLSKWSGALLKGEAPKGLAAETEPIIARSDARLSARRLSPRRARYQLARFCEWGKESPEEYTYQVTAASLRAAREQGLTVSQLLALLNKYSKAVPPSLVKALERWDAAGSEARLEKVLILRVTSADILQALRKTRAGRFLGEPLGPTTVTVKAGAAQKVLGALAELGYLGEIRGKPEES